MSTGVVNSSDALPRTDMICAQQARTDDGPAFFRGLRASRLLSEDEVRALEVEFEASPDRPLADVVYAGRLTRYQFDRIADGKPTGLAVGPYRVLDEIGRGGGGAVYSARHVVMNRTVALKVIDPRYTADRSAEEVFQREVAATVRLDHPNVVRVYDANACDGVFYIAMEFLRGTSLHRYVATHGPLDPAAACTALLQLAAALDHAHENGLVHRDVKPANIIVLDAGRGESLRRLKILDFGLARLCRSADEAVATIYCPAGAAIGTPAFMSPEQIRDFHSADIRSDLYSLGCTFYFALSGRLPFQGATTSATLMMHLSREAAPLRSVCPAVPVGLAGVVHRLMAKNPTDRYQTPAELAAAVNALILADAPAAPAPVPVAAVAAPVVGLCPPSTTPYERVARPVLCKLWQEWCSAIVTGTDGAYRPLGEAAYQQLHRRLLAGVAAVVQNEPDAALWSWALSCAEPWVTLASLAHLDDRTRAELFLRAQEIGDRLFPPATAFNGDVWPTLAAAVVFAAVAALVVLYGSWVPSVPPELTALLVPRNVIAAALLVPVLILAVAVRRART